MIASELGRVNPTKWIVRQSIVFDWFDGPKQGICALDFPLAEFEFRCIAKKHNPNGVDHRLYTLHELPIGSVDLVLDLIGQLGTPESKVWIPVWNFGTEEEKQHVDARIDQLLDKSESSNLVIYSYDTVSILGCWFLDSLPTHPEELFDLLGITNG